MQSANRTMYMYICNSITSNLLPRSVYNRIQWTLKMKIPLISSFHKNVLKNKKNQNVCCEHKAFSQPLSLLTNFYINYNFFSSNFLLSILIFFVYCTLCKVQCTFYKCETRIRIEVVNISWCAFNENYGTMNCYWITNVLLLRKYI